MTLGRADWQMNR